MTTATPNANGSFNHAVLVWGSANPEKVGQVRFFNKVSMLENFKVSGVIAGGGLSVDGDRLYTNRG